MTPTPARQPQQEYIITWEQLNLLYHADAGVSPYEPNNPDDTFEYPIPEVKPILDAIRSRPRTSPPAPEQGLNFRPECPHHMYYEEYMGEPERHICNKRREWETSAAKAERKKVLDELSEEFLDGEICYEGQFIHKKLLSLRAQQQGGVSE